MNSMFLIYFKCLVFVASGSVIEFHATPSEIKNGLTPTVTLHCSLNDTSSSAQIVGRRDVTRTTENMKEVTSLIVMHNGQDIASVSHLNPPHDMVGKANVKVTGSVTPAPGEKGFLQVSFEFPTQDQSGEFVCEANAVSDSGHIVTFSTSLEIGAADPTTADLVTYVREMSQAMKTKEDALEKVIADMKTNESAMTQQIAELQSRTHPAVLFSAGLTKDLTIPAGQVLVYDKIYSNLGGGYSPSTGIFTCQTAGYYLFSLSALSDFNKVFWLDVQVNNKHQFAIYGPSSHSHQGHSNSAILRLKTGDKVNVVAVYESVVTDRPDEIYVTFSGHLVASA